jgi:O-antigen/teichoic acid export membrane protein
MLLALARLGTQEMVGQFTLGFAVTAPIVMFTNLNLRQVYVTDCRQKDYFDDYYTFRLLSISVAFLFVTLFSLIGGYSYETASVVFLVGMLKLVEATSDIFYAFLQRRECMQYIAISQTIKGISSLIVLVFLIKLTRNIVIAVLGVLAVWFLVCVCLDLNVFATVRSNNQSSLNPDQIRLQRRVSIYPRFVTNWPVLRDLFSKGLPLGAAMLLISLNTNLPNYLIEKNLGIKELGIFSAILYLIEVGNRFVMALGDSSQTRLASYYSNLDYRSFQKMLLFLALSGFLIGGFGVVLSCIAGETTLSFIYTADYAKEVNVFRILMGVALVRYISSFLNYGVLAARYFRCQILIYGASMVALVLCCFYFLPLLGLVGVALSLLIASLVQLIGCLTALFHSISKIKYFGNSDLV